MCADQRALTPAPDAMPLLFAYGTLQDHAVQLSVFGRRLHGTADELPAFEPALVRIVDAEEARATGRTHYPNVKETGSTASRVVGTVFDVSEGDLYAADAYELPAGYDRVVVTLVSGRRAWVYVHPGVTA